MSPFQEIEEDRKRAEQEGMAVTSRRPRADGLTITITKAHNVSILSFFLCKRDFPYSVHTKLDL